MSGLATAARPPRIGVLDSGVGGFSILASLRARLPHAAYVYAADHAHFPYGERDPDDVIRCTLAAASALVAVQAPDLLVLACNTASTVALPALRAHLALPIVGTVPAVKPAAAQTRSGVIGVLATPGTVARPYMDELIERHAAGLRVIRIGSSALVTAAEAKMRGLPIALTMVRREIAGLFRESAAAEARLDTVVLGCTHFPLLAAELAEAAAWPVAWLDSGAAIAARVEALLAELPGQVPQSAPQTEPAIFMTTAALASAVSLAPMLASWGFGPAQHLTTEGFS